MKAGAMASRAKRASRFLLSTSSGSGAGVILLMVSASDAGFALLTLAHKKSTSGASVRAVRTRPRSPACAGCVASSS
eukprot:scaffold329699_cov64-Tisochrysis_lutea.AAC.3